MQYETLLVLCRQLFCLETDLLALYTYLCTTYYCSSIMLTYSAHINKENSGLSLGKQEQEFARS